MQPADSSIQSKEVPLATMQRHVGSAFSASSAVKTSETKNLNGATGMNKPGGEAGGWTALVDWNATERIGRSRVNTMAGDTGFLMNVANQNQHWISKHLLKRVKTDAAPLQCYQVETGDWLPKGLDRTCAASGYNQLLLSSQVDNTLEAAFSKVESGETMYRAGITGE